MKKISGSRSEDNGLSLLTSDEKLVYSIGVSTGGIAEIRMVVGTPERHVIATTVDEKGLKEAQDFIKKQGLDRQVEIKLEDVSAKLPYVDDYFDFIYARLVLHYLSRAELKSTLSEIRRVLKPGKKLHVVVRSDKCPAATSDGARHEESTGFTYYKNPVENVGTRILKRFFHTEDTISKFIEEAGFMVDRVESYEERLFADFMRTVPAPHADYLIEVRARK